MMSTCTNVAKASIAFRLFCAVLLTFLASSLFASYVDARERGANKVEVVQDENGWKLLVDGEDFYVKGMVWGYSPRNENYTYNLWGQSDEFIQKVLDHDFGLMAAGGVTAVRTFSIIPPKWVTYIYDTHGIMSVINPLMGRYGANIGGVWRPFTNYQDPLTRETLKRESLALVEQYKDVPGVLMFAFGNESNYGLSWSSFEIENLPEGEQHREKARYLYSLWGEVVKGAQEISPNHPATIVNGDIQYLDLIAEYLPHMEILGSNVYRGISFTDMWSRVKNEYDRPLLFFEFGSDAFNARDFREDSPSQARFLKGQWREMYQQSYGNGGEGNSIGGFVFEFRDEWWKFKQTENLDIQDTNASWENGGYTFDHVPGQNNMNEEWFGIARLGDLNSDGIYEAVPRMAYDVLKDVFSIDPYTSTRTEINEHISNISMDALEAKSEVRLLKATVQEQSKVGLIGGSIQADFIAKADEVSIDADDEDGLQTTDGLMAFLDVGFQPNDKISGRFSVNVLANVVESEFEFQYGDRGQPIRVNVLEDGEGENVGTTTISDTELEGRERIEIYDFEAKYEGEAGDLLTFYHVPRYHWGYEGDYFGLLRETTDMEGQDIWNDKAPYGVEFQGKQNLKGLKVLLGPEVYWGANPKIMAKYEWFSGPNEYAFVISEDISERDAPSGGTEATIEEGRQATLYGQFNFTDDVKLELGGIISGTERRGDEYDVIDDDGNVVVDKVDLEDALGARAKLSFAAFPGSLAYIGVDYAGIVADAGNPLTEWGTSMPYSSLGNKQEVDAGINMTFGDFRIFPRAMYRENIVDAIQPAEATFDNGTIDPGVGVRNRNDDPFAVYDNREVTAGELIVTYDPTPASDFYHWNVDMIEDAEFAMNAGFTYMDYKTSTDGYTFFAEEFDVNAAFGEGLAAEELWLFKSKMIFNPSRDWRVVTNFEAGKQQSTGDPEGGSTEYYGFHYKLIKNKKHIFSGYVEKDAFGQYDFFRQFNITFPWQYKLEYAYLLDSFNDELSSSQVGIRMFYRTLDENSLEDVWDEGNNEYQTEIGTYFVLRF